MGGETVCLTNHPINCAQEFPDPAAAKRRCRVAPQDTNKSRRRAPGGVLNIVYTDTGIRSRFEFEGPCGVGRRAKNVPDLGRSSQGMKIRRG